MSDPTPTQPRTGVNREEMMSALFAQMVIQQTNIAMMLLGQVPHPETGKTMRDLEGARMFIDQLEMLQAKTKGNLSGDEEKLLKQSLQSLRMMFVDAVEAPAPSASASPAPAQTPSTTADEPVGEKTSPAAGAETEADSRKKFSKKY